jgi:DNA-binding response OmpR family regulator
MMGARGTILLVEDSPADEMLIQRVFEKNHIANRVDVARDGQEALDYLLCQGAFADRDPDERPNIVILDLKLPKVNGLEVLRSIRSNERLASLPVVILTSSSEERDIVDSYNLGANSYIRKPVDFDQFSDAVMQLGLYWLVLNQSLPGR